MKQLLSFVMVLVTLYGASANEITSKKIYETPFLTNAPFGVEAWAQSEMVKNGQGKETRFVDYNSAAAKGLILDATTQRSAEKDNSAATRETAFYSVYDEKGWYVYIEAEEPLIKSLLDDMVDPQSAARNEGYEIFFAPGLHTVPYYQIFTRPFAGDTEFFDWSVPHRHYRSLKTSVKVESRPLGQGFGTFIFIPWESLYERLPRKDEYWRFSIIRWMPYGKAGGTTWGGQVHDTGNFALLHFQAPTTEQRNALKKRMLRIAWFKFRASAKAATTHWSDAKIGDLEFYNEVLKLVIERNIALGESLGKPDEWAEDALAKAGTAIPDWMEFDYKVSELRDAFLKEKRFRDVP